MDEIRQLPNDFEAERRVVGACLLDTSIVGDVLAKLDDSDFYTPTYQLMFSALRLLKLSNAPVGVEAVLRQLERMRVKDMSALEYIGGGTQVRSALAGVEPAEWEFWAQSVREKREQREIVEFADEARRAALSGEEIHTVRARMEEGYHRLYGAGSGDDVYTPFDLREEITQRITRYIDEPDAITGIPLGWPQFDAQLDGLQPGNVTVVYAPSSRFKSMFVANMVWRMARNGTPGLWYTTEMPRLQVHERMVNLQAGVNLRRLRREGTIAQHRDQVNAAITELSQFPVFYCDTSDPEIGAVIAETMRQKRWNDIQYLVVDLLDHIRADGYDADSVAAQSHVMRQFKKLAKRAGIHIILVSHISKQERGQRTSASPDPEDMKGSSSKFQDADTAISVMPVAYDPGDGDKKPAHWRGMTRNELAMSTRGMNAIVMYVDVVKNRHGETGHIFFEMDFLHGQRMKPITEGEAFTVFSTGLPTGTMSLRYTG